MRILMAWLGALLLACLAAPAHADDAAALDAATRALCDQKIVLLGEAGSHGDGHTLAFKAQLAQRLIDRCHFRAIVFEASYYEFAHLSDDARGGQPVTAEGIAVALSGLWNRYPDMQPFMRYLADRANTGGQPGLGTYVHQTYGQHVFSLGFGAVGGTYSSVADPRAEPISPPPSASRRAG